MTSATPPSARLLLHGVPRCLLADGRELRLEAKDALLLAWLALQGPTPRGKLATLLWPEAGSERARAALRQRLARLKKAAGVELLAAGETAALVHDVVHEAADGELLATIELDPESELGAWLAAQRAKGRQLRAEWLAAAAAQAEAEGELAAALSHAQALVELDPTSEHAHRRVMRLHYLRGDRAAALAAYERCREVLRRELKVAPSDETETLRRQVAGATASAVVPRMVPMTILRPPRLIGRDAEWTLLNEAWLASAAAIVIGEPGMGKTRLLTDLLATQPQGLLVTARPGDARVPYALLSRLVRALVLRIGDGLATGVRAELARLLPELGAAEPMKTDADRARFVNAVDALLASAVAGGMTGIAVDDLQFADAATVETLQHLAEADGRLAWTIAYRPGELSPEGTAMASDLEQSRRAIDLRLRPLTTSEVSDLIDSLGVATWRGDALAPQIAQHTGGNPLYVLETLKAMLTQGEVPAAPARLPVARNVAALIERRITQLSPESIRLARCAAVAGQDFSAELAAQVLDTNALDLADAWNELERAQVFRDGAFVHDLIYEAALASVPAPIATHLHGRIAGHLESVGADPGRVAAHWLEAHNNERALAALQAAASAAGRALRSKEQAALLAQAADVAESLGRSEEAFVNLAAAIERLMSVDRAAASDALLERVERLAARDGQLALVLRLRAERATHFGEHGSAARDAERAVRLAQRAGDEALAVQAQQLQAVNASMAGDYERAAALMQPLIAWFARHGSPDDQLEFYGHLALVLDNADRTDEALPFHRRATALAGEGASRDNLPTLLGNLACNRMDAGDMQAALDALQEGERERLLHDELRGAGAPAMVMLVAVLRDLGRYDEALRWAEMSVSFLRDQNPLALPALHAHIACLWLHLGQPARAQRELDVAASSSDTPRWIQARCAQMAMRLALAGGRDATRSAALALELAPRGGRAVLREMILLDHAVTLPPAAALSVAEQIAIDSAPRGHRGTTLAAHLRACRFASATGRSEQAAEFARRALESQAETAPNDLYPAELWLNAWHALFSVDLAAAQRALENGVQWVRHVAETHVPAEFRDSFLNRNPVNRELLTLATRALRSAGPPPLAR